MDDVRGCAHVKMRKTGSHQHREKTVIMRWKEPYRAQFEQLMPLACEKSTALVLACVTCCRGFMVLARGSKLWAELPWINGPELKPIAISH